MNIQARHPFRVLIVDDELRDWARPMKEALERTAKDLGHSGRLEIDIAEDKIQAEAFLGRHNYQVTSLDMRLPEHKGGLLSVNPGLSLARGFPWVGFPKLLVYSMTLRIKEFQDHPSDAIMVLQLPADLYAKPTGADTDTENRPIEMLAVKAWAKRVADSLLSDELKLSADRADRKRLTVIGAYLEHGVNASPPLLASHLQRLSNNWTQPKLDRVEAAVRFIEAAARLAFVQSAVLCEAQGESVDIPGEENWFHCCNTLKELRKRLNGWNWCNYLTNETINAFHTARIERNIKSHSLEDNDAVKWWANLRLPLQYAIDLAAYWVRHPLTVDLRCSPDGWSAELLAGLANPRSRHLLPQDMNFPPEAVGNGIWQNVWRLSSDTKKDPERKPLNWATWLVPDSHVGNRWWFPVSQKGRSRNCLDLVSGSTSNLSL